MWNVIFLLLQKPGCYLIEDDTQLAKWGNGDAPRLCHYELQTKAAWKHPQTAISMAELQVIDSTECWQGMEQQELTIIECIEHYSCLNSFKPTWHIKAFLCQ